MSVIKSQFSINNEYHLFQFTVNLQLKFQLRLVGRWRGACLFTTKLMYFFFEETWLNTTDAPVCQNFRLKNDETIEQKNLHFMIHFIYCISLSFNVYWYLIRVHYCNQLDCRNDPLNGFSVSLFLSVWLITKLCKCQCTCHMTHESCLYIIRYDQKRHNAVQYFHWFCYSDAQQQNPCHRTTQKKNISIGWSCYLLLPDQLLICIRCQTFSDSTLNTTTSLSVS